MLESTPFDFNEDFVNENLSKALKQHLAIQDAAKSKAISLKQFKKRVDEIESRLTHIEKSILIESPEKLELANTLLEKIELLKGKMDHQENFTDLLDVTNLRGLYKKYDAKFLSLQSRIIAIIDSLSNSETIMRLDTEEEAKKMVNAAQFITERRKIQLAYRSICNGRKYKKALLKKSKKNPIKILSNDNIKNLKEKLRKGLQEDIQSGKMPKNKDNQFGLRPDEIDLFEALLNLPYKLQHATNHFTKIAREGSLNSLTEIHRKHSQFQSPFTTSANLDELGNGGFVFFRCYVDGNNGEKTRYGETRITANIDLLRKVGWISLHDQLVPFSNKQRKQTFYKDKRIIFQAKPTSIKNKAKANKSADGIQYEYRVTPTGNYDSGIKDKQKDFGKNIQTKIEKIKFTDEIFYAQDILPGIALSMIYRLRQLESCGYRKTIIDEFNRYAKIKRIIFLGELIKDFYRIEGKYPAKLPLEYHNHEISFFKPYAKSDEYRFNSDRKLDVENPDGDGRLNLDLSINSEDTILAFCEDRFKRVTDKISVLQKRPNDQVALNELNELKEEEKELKSKIAKAKRQKQEFIEDIKYACERENTAWIEKRSYGYLKLLSEIWLSFIEDRTVRFNELKNMSLKRLSLLSHETWIGLLTNQQINWNELNLLTDKELEEMTEVDLTASIEDKGFLFDDLLAYHRDEPDKFEWATCDDFDDLVLDYAPDFPDGMINFIEESGHQIDWDFVRESLSSSEQSRLDIELGVYDTEELSGTDEEAFDDDIGYLPCFRN